MDTHRMKSSVRLISRGAFASLIAVLAMSVGGTAAALAALPEFSGTFPTTETSSPINVAFEATSGDTLKCEGSNAAFGEITGSKTITQSWDLRHCAIAGAKCSSAGAAEGEVQIKSITGTLVYLSKTSKEVGIAYNPWEPNPLEPKSLEVPRLVSVKCAVLGTVELKGTMLGHLTPTNKSTSSLQAQFLVSGFEQSPNSFENEGHKWGVHLEMLLSSGETRKTALSESETMATSRAIEVKA
jgi:hypothetical protein